MKTKKKQQEKKKLLASKLLGIIYGGVQYVLMFFLSVLIYSGHKIYTKAQPTEALVSWGWLSLTFLLCALLIYCLIKFKYRNVLSFSSVFILIIPILNVSTTWIYTLSMIFFVVGIIYDFLIAFGMKEILK